MKQIICWLFGHSRGKTWCSAPCLYLGQRGFPQWNIKCKRCGYKVSYTSPMCRLVGQEMLLGFDGK